MHDLQSTHLVGHCNESMRRRRCDRLDRGVGTQDAMDRSQIPTRIARRQRHRLDLTSLTPQHPCRTPKQRLTGRQCTPLSRMGRVPIDRGQNAVGSKRPANHLATRIDTLHRVFQPANHQTNRSHSSRRIRTWPAEVGSPYLHTLLGLTP